MTQQLLPQVGRCIRCQAPCAVSGPKDPQARMLRRSEKPEGQCVHCAVREWFYVMEQQGSIRDLKPQELLHPWIQQQMGRVMKASRADADLSEIDWAKVVRDWDLPIPGAGKKGRRRPVPGGRPKLRS